MGGNNVHAMITMIKSLQWLYDYNDYNDCNYCNDYNYCNDCNDYNAYNDYKDWLQRYKMATVETWFALVLSTYIPIYTGNWSVAFRYMVPTNLLELRFMEFVLKLIKGSLKSWNPRLKKIILFEKIDWKTSMQWSI